MSVLEDIKSYVNNISKEMEIEDDKAFGYWFLEDIEEYSPEKAEMVITDGPWDGGVDALDFNEETRILNIYQFKYSEDINYVLKAFNDIQRGLIKEEDIVKKAEEIKLFIVSLINTNETIRAKEKEVTENINSWLKKNNYQAIAGIEIYDLRKFSQIYEKIYGIKLELKFKHDFEESNALLGLLDASTLKDYVDREELLAFNIRKFIGLRKGSVNWQIHNSLKDKNQRDIFWMLNNGIVCLCTDRGEPKIEEGEIKKYSFENFTVVNGAQTINTIARFLNENPTVDCPIWVLSKIIKVNENDINSGLIFTKTSNTQTPANNVDLRALDTCHKKIEDWMIEKGYDYLYKRGQKTNPKLSPIYIKELAQAYVAYWIKEPQVSFSNPGKIFNNDEYYEKIFPKGDIENIHLYGEKSAKNEFIQQRLIPILLIRKIREYLENLTGEDKSKKKPFAFHLLYIYSKIFEISKKDLYFIESNYQDILNNTLPKIIDGTINHFVSLERDFPQYLKNADSLDDLSAEKFYKLSQISEAVSIIRKMN